MTLCDHCMLPVQDREAVHEDTPAGRKSFCCHACRSIYRMIQQEGLGDFYAKRDWTTFGIPEPLRLLPTGEALQAEQREAVELSGDTAADEADLIIDGIRCPSCIWLNEKVLERTPGVLSVRINFATHRALVRWDRTKTTADQIMTRIRSIGYLPHPYTSSSLEESLRQQNRDLLLRFGTAAFCSMQLMTLSFGLYAGYFQGIDSQIKHLLEFVSFLLCTPVILYAGWPFAAGAYRGVRNGVLNMDALIVLGSWAAYGLSIVHIVRGGEVYFDTSAMIITLVLLGRYLENSAKQRASQAVTRLFALQPRDARIIRNGERVMVSTTSVRRGDMLEVRPGERIPLDGVVRDGATEADESLISGESLPRTKTEGSSVIGGSLNGLGTIVIEVMKTGPDTVVAQIARIVERAQAESAPIQRIADRVSAIFIPFVTTVAGMSFWYWYLSGSAAQAVLVAVSVLVISCPCALGLATPIAVLAGTGRAASRGILVKGGDILERMHRVDMVVFDKTGTVTAGVLRVERVQTVPTHASDGGVRSLLQLAASAEQSSEHLLGAAIVRAAADEGIPLLPCASFQAIPGEGARASVSGSTVLVGRRAFLQRFGVNVDPAMAEAATELEEQGKTVVYVARDRSLQGIIGLMDGPRSDAAEAVQELRKRSIDVRMITGDNERTARAIGDLAGIGAVSAEISPGDKAQEIRRFQIAGKVVAMVGDGINDAPALATADVGIAMATGSDIAMEAADIIVMRGDLGAVPEAIVLSRRTFRIIRQNLFWAFFYNVCAIPLAMAGILSPIVAAAAMSVSSITVVLNSLRLRRGARA